MSELVTVNQLERKNNSDGRAIVLVITKNKKRILNVN